MAAIDFPASPVDGQTYSQNGMTWKFAGTTGIWNKQTLPNDLWNTSYIAVTYSYNASGDIHVVTEDTLDGLRETTFTYTAEGRLDSATIQHLGFSLQRVEAYTYNADGVLVSMSTQETEL